MPRSRSQTVVTVGSRSQIYCHRPPAPSPATFQLPRSPKQPFTWTNGVMGAVSPLLLYTEEGKLEARAVGLRSVGCAWSARTRSGTSSWLCHRESEDQGHTGSKNQTMFTDCPRSTVLGRSFGPVAPIPGSTWDHRLLKHPDTQAVSQGF